jgi:renalase
VGGRCATRTVDGQLVDYGPVFLHGSDPLFLTTLLAATSGVPGAAPAFDWPVHVLGGGAPCQPDSLQPNQRRVVFAQGIAAFPKHLAEGLDVQLSTLVRGITAGERTLSVQTESGALQAQHVVIALALEQTRELLKTLPATREVSSAAALLAMFTSVPSLTLIAGYDVQTPRPAWDVHYPEDSSCFQLIAHDSSKRTEPAARVLVMQARPRWSRERLALPSDTWAAEMLVEAARRLGAWAGTPRFTHAHRWSFARLERGAELGQPLRITLPGGQHVGLAGDVFAPGGGVQAAWLSGIRLAERFLQETT